MDRLRDILHVDLDAFYASVEQRDDPSLRGRPVIVAGPPPRGVVAAASYEARTFGVKSAIPTAMALQRCPHVVVIRPRIEHYATISAAFFEILESYSPLVEGLSLDEAFLDVTGSRELFGDGVAIASLIKQRVRAELGLVVSVGLAPSKFVAKIASDLGKPDGLLRVPPDRILAFLHPLPVSRLWGVGEVTDEALRGIGLRTIGDVARARPDILAARIGEDRSRHLMSLARGEDDRPVVPERKAVSIGAEETYDVDHHDRAALRPHLLAQVDKACRRLRAQRLRAAVVTVKVKYADHTLVTRRETLPRPTTDQRVVGDTALALLAAVPAIERRGVRLTGVSLGGLGPEDAPRQLTLDEPGVERGEQLGKALDAIDAKFGRGSVKRALHVEPEPDARPDPDAAD